METVRLTKLAFRSIKARKIRSVLTIAGVAIGVALIFAVAITNQAIIGSFLDVVSDLSGAADLQATSVSTGPFSAEVSAKIEKTKGVETAAPIVSRSTEVTYKKGSDYLRIIGIDRVKEEGFRDYRLKSGRFLSAGRCIVLVKPWADERRLKVGSKIKLAGVNELSEFKIVGLLAKVGPGAADNGSVGFINLKNSQRLFGLKGKLTQVDVKDQTGAVTASVKSRLSKKLGAGYEVRRPAEKGSSIEAVTGGVMGAFGSFGSLALFVGAFVVFNTMMMSVAERLRDIGILRLVGASRSQILKVILIETVFFGLSGSLIGLVLGQVMARGLAQQVASIYHISLTRISAPAGWEFAAFATGIIVSSVAGIQPAFRASRVTPMEGLRLETSQKSAWLERYGWLTGLIFIAAGAGLFLSPLKERHGTFIFDASAGLLFIGVALFSVLLVILLTVILAPLIKRVFGIEGRLAIDSIDKGRSRVALAVVTLLVSLSMIIASGELSLAQHAFIENWIASILPFDVSVRTPLPLSVEDVNKYTPIDIGLRNRIEKVKGVAFVTPVKFVLAKGLGRTIFVIAVEGKSWRHTSKLKFEEGNKEQALNRFDSGGEVMISSTITSKNDIHAGQRIKLKTPAGVRSFKVSGVFPEVANDGYVLYVSRRDQLKYWNDSTVDGFDITLKHRTNLEAVTRQLRRAVGGVSGVSVVSGRDVRSEIRDSVDRFLSILNALVLVAVAVAALGIVNTLAMSVLERVREIGILRAIGTSRRQIGKTILAEAAAIGVMGAILGSLVGLVISWELVIISQLVGGWKVPFIFPAEYLLLAAVISVAVAMLSSLYPAREASKVDIVKAVQWE